MALSLGQAAVAVRMSKPTIQRSIKNGKLSASRNEDGSYSIDESELARVYPEQWRSRHVAGTLKQVETLSNPDALQVEIEGLRQQIAMLQDERDDLRRRLDAEAEERRRLTQLLTDQRAAVSVPVEKPGGGLAQGVSERYLPNVRLLTRGVPTHLGILHDAGHESPWIIVMDCLPTRAAVLDYGARWAIEPLFSDFKSRGFQLEDTQLRATARLDRVILIMTLAMYWCVRVGRHDARYNPIPIEKKPRPRPILTIGA